jgi:hypothetical protein
MRRYEASLCLCGLLSAACAVDLAEGSGGDPVESATNVAPLYRLDVAPDHSVEFYDMGEGARLFVESAPAGTEPVAYPTSREFAPVFHLFRPDDELPAVLREADAKLASRSRSQSGVGLVTQAATTDEWIRKTGGCACPVGRVVHRYCKQNRAGNWSDTQNAEYAWWNINHLSGNGMDVFTTCNDKNTKIRWNPGRVDRLTCIGPDNFFDIDDVKMRLAINGADDDRMDLGACWSIVDSPF